MPPTPPATAATAPCASSPMVLRSLTRKSSKPATAVREPETPTLAYQNFDRVLRSQRCCTLVGIMSCVERAIRTVTSVRRSVRCHPPCFPLPGSGDSRWPRLSAPSTADCSGWASSAYCTFSRNRNLYLPSASPNPTDLRMKGVHAARQNLDVADPFGLVARRLPTWAGMADNPALDSQGGGGGHGGSSPVDLDQSKPATVRSAALVWSVNCPSTGPL